MKAKVVTGMEEAEDLYMGRGKSGRSRKGKRGGRRRGRRKGGR
jgi:hypothetical protein